MSNKYNKSSDYMETYTINLDWLEITTTGMLFDLDSDISTKTIKDHYEIGELTLIRKHDKLYGYRCKFQIQINKQSIGYLLYKKSDHTSVFQKHLSRIHIYNNILYQENWSASLVKILEILKLTFYGYHRLDIAIDGYNFITKFNSLFRSNKYQLIRNIKPRGSIDSDGLFVSNIKIGSEYSDKLINIYSKEELLKKHYKNHIIKFWEVNNLFPKEGSKIDRIELRLRGSAATDIQLDQLTNFKYLSTIAKDNFYNSLRFLKINPKQKNKSRWKSLEFIELDTLATKDVKTLTKAIAVKSVRPKKTTIQHLFRENKISGHTCFTQAITIMVKRYQLEDWYGKNYNKWK